MKRILFYIVFLASGMNVLAQQENAVRAISPYVPVPQPGDFLKPDEGETNLPPVVPDRTDQDGYPHSFSGNRTVVAPDKHRKGTNIFNAPYSKFIIPTVLISYGVLAGENHWIQGLDYTTNHEIGEHFTETIRLDNYTQFVPAAGVYGLALMGVRPEHNFRDRTFVLATSYLLMFASVQTLKSATRIARPDESNRHSFPSGHTAAAFAGAHVLFREYKGVSPWIGVAGYAVACGTGVMRVYNKKHWISDVATGAGIGILSAEIGYLLLPLSHRVGVKGKQKKSVIVPVGSDRYGVGLACIF